jgi:uncharacterized protein
VDHPIIGRKYEQQLLSEVYLSPKAEFIAMYGRRRIGKTYLIENFFTNKSCLFVTIHHIAENSL